MMTFCKSFLYIESTLPKYEDRFVIRTFIQFQMGKVSFITILL